MNNSSSQHPQQVYGFLEGQPHPSSQGEQTLFALQQKFGYLHDFEFNVPIGCDRGYDEESGRHLGTAWISPDLSHQEARIAIEIDGIQHRLPNILNDDSERDCLLAQEGWKVLRFSNYWVCDPQNHADALFVIEYEVMSSLIVEDMNAGVPLHRRRYGSAQSLVDT